jgi:acetamidase/formamidase
MAATWTTRNSAKGATLYLPVWAPGALFSAGDGHGVRGAGEVCINALEICLTGTFTLTLDKGGGARPDADLPAVGVRKPLHLDGHARGPRHGDENRAAPDDRLHHQPNESVPPGGIPVVLLAVDFHVTQTVNGEKGVHGLLKKGLLF